MTLESVVVRVARGVALLDERMPGWVDKIDTQRLQIRDRCGCIIGQLLGNFCERYRIGPEVMGWGAYQLGFDASAFGALEEYEELQTEWLRVINERKADAPKVVWTHREPVTAGRG